MEKLSDAEMAAMTDDDLVTSWWFSDALSDECVGQIEEELKRRGIDPMKNDNVALESS
jgi:hypothetical protein